MIRQYKIHTDLDGSDNKIFDMNDGKIRFYQPSDLGITATTNIWKSDGIGIFGNSQVNHPQLDFKLETFGDSLEENYQIFNEFINAILAKKFVTLEYTTSLGTFYADVKLSKVTKTEAYGFNGTFSEKISFDTITAWYTYEQLKFSKFENGKFNENTKIHADAEQEAVEKMKGGNVTAFERKSASEIDTHAKKMRLNTITYPLKIIVADASSNDMAIDQENYDYGVSVINELSRKGYNIIIEPYPFIASGTVGETEWNPTNKTLWFDNWKKVVEKIASLATSLNCKYYVASNLVKIENESDKWVSLIRYLKGKYTAKLIYRTNWWVTASWAPETITAYNAKLNNPLFGEVDEIAIAAYFELTDEDIPSVETLKQAIKSTTKFNRQQNVYEEVKAFYTKWNKPVIFGELGIAPYRKAASTPWKYEYSDVDYYEEVQANWYEAWIETFKSEDWFGGYSIFIIATQDNMFTVTKLGEKTLKTLNSTGVGGRYTYSDTSYVYSSEENIDRFSKWLIKENIFSFVARLTPSKNVENKKYGLRFLNSDANEYSAIVFNLQSQADVIQINTDSNDEYYQAIFNGQAVNMFSALDFQRFRTRLFEKGSMELIGLDSVEMNVKRKVDFV